MKKTTTAKSKIPQRLSREESQAITRDKLIATATRLLVEKGYGGTSIRDIAEQSGYSQGAFYSNYESKEALLLEMLRRHMQSKADQLTALVQQKQRSPEEILHELERWALTIDQDVNWSMLSVELQLHARRSLTFAAEYQNIWLKHRDVLGQCIEILFSQCKVKMPASTEEIASSFMALAHGLALQHMTTESAAPGRMIVLLLRSLIELGKSQEK